VTKRTQLLLQQKNEEAQLRGWEEEEKENNFSRLMIELQ
jgi:hypothetical protein